MPQQNFLEEYVLQILRQSGFEKLSEDNKAELLPQFVVEAQRRIGAAILPLLDEPTAEQFVVLAREETTPDEWWKFWNASVPDFTDVVQRALEGFGAEMRNALAG